jgi:Ni,Fe-hydrogenase III large subunit
MTVGVRPRAAVRPASEVLSVEQVAAAQFSERCRAAVEAGERFCGLFARRAGDDSDVVALFAGPQGRRAVIAPAGAGVSSVTDVVPAADWDEREAHDLYGVDFLAHRPLRPIVTHTEDLTSWVVPVSGQGVHQVAVGPIHAGVIESGHFRFHVVGERVLHLDVRLCYKHRGLEVAAEGLPPERAIDIVGRACAACWVANTVAFAMACEAAGGARVDPDVARARTILLELERLYNHLHDLGAVCAGVGFAIGSMRFAALKEEAQRLNSLLTGHRFLFRSVRLWGSDLAIEADGAPRLRRELARLRSEYRRAWREVLFNGSVQDRLSGIGVLSGDDARRLGTVGPALRASGVDHDLRTASPRLRYEGFVPARLEQPRGDVAARVEMRAAELEATFTLLDALLAEGQVRPASTRPGRERTQLGVGGVEGARGETWCALEVAERRVARVHLRTASYANWPSVAHAAAEALIADFPLVNKSFELCYACADR